MTIIERIKDHKWCILGATAGFLVAVGLGAVLAYYFGGAITAAAAGTVTILRDRGVEIIILTGSAAMEYARKLKA